MVYNCQKTNTLLLQLQLQVCPQSTFLTITDAQGGCNEKIYPKKKKNDFDKIQQFVLIAQCFCSLTHKWSNSNLILKSQ